VARGLGVVVVASAAVAGLMAAGGGRSAGAHPAAQGFAAAPTALPGANTNAVAQPLKGKIVGIDPGHNGNNRNDPGYLATLVWNGLEWEMCDTTGTATDSGYTEALFNFRVAEYLRADLIRDGARVVMTRNTNNGIGPCVNKRSFIINNFKILKAHVNVAVDIHADGTDDMNTYKERGFAILEPENPANPAHPENPLGDTLPNKKVLTSSARLGADIRAAMLAGTSMPVSNYDGKNGIKHRDDLAGLNLTTVPKILIEVGNMRNATDAKLLTSAKFQQQVARALLAAIIRFLR
jgi:N-acetylmuramoyl-L-alanine amidase